MNDIEIVDYVITKAKSLGATDVDAIIINSQDLSAEVRLGKIVNLDRSASKAIGVRALINQQQAIVSTSDFNKLDLIIEQAISMARVTPKNEHLLIATKDQYTRNFRDLDLYDAYEPKAEELIELVKSAEDYALADKRITNSEGASAGYGSSEMIFANSNGFSNASKRSSSSYYVSVIAGEGENMQSSYSYSQARHRENLKSPEEVGKEAAKRTIEKLSPRKIDTGEMSIIIDRKIAGQFISYLASAVNGSAISRGTSFLLDSLGKKLFGNEINIIDDPFIVRGLASRAFDGEGIEGRKLNIIENGILTNYFLDLETASKLKMVTTGHASRSLSSAPSPSCSNLYLEKGKNSVEEMIKSVRKGILITETFGHGAKIVTGDYSQGASGFYIENGEIQYPVSEITIASNLREIFSQMIPASDLKFDSSINSPSLFIEKIMVAGK